MQTPARVPPPAGQPRVFVITTPGSSPAAPASSVTHQPHLFGVHFHDKRTQEYTSHVFGFTDGQHARLVAKGLESYYRRHGTFPPRDRRPRFLELRGMDPGVQLEHVEVLEMGMPDLLHRLQGSGITVSLLTRDAAKANGGGGKHRFQARTVTTDTTSVSVVAALNRNWRASGGDTVWRSRARYMTYDHLVAPLAARVKSLALSPARTLHAIPGLPSSHSTVPRLLPKPTWPPSPSPSSAAGDVPVAMQVLAASFLKCLALAEVLTLFYLFPSLM